MRYLYLTSTEKTVLCKIWWPVCSIYATESRRKTFLTLTEREGKLMDSLWLSITFGDARLLDRGDMIESDITETWLIHPEFFIHDIFPIPFAS